MGLVGMLFEKKFPLQILWSLPMILNPIAEKLKRLSKSVGDQNVGR
jgi:hypothetical protein